MNEEFRNGIEIEIEQIFMEKIKFKVRRRNSLLHPLFRIRPEYSVTRTLVVTENLKVIIWSWLRVLGYTPGPFRGHLKM